MVNTLTIPSEVKNKLKVLSSKQNRKIKDLVLEAIDDVLKKYGEDQNETM